MQFRAVMKGPQYMREFQNIINTLSRLAKECVIKISADKLLFTANEESGTTSPLVWIEIDVKVYFAEYTMQGTSAEYPHIMLSVSTSNLARALGGVRYNARFCKFKLANIQFPCLSIESDVLTQKSEQPRQIVHDVPVSVIPRCDWPTFAIPDMPDAKIVLNMPSNRLMRGLIDKLKNLSPTIIFHATSEGEMNIVAETEMATITTRYKNLELCRLQPSLGDREKQVMEATCAVDCKKTAIFFSALQVPTLELSCGIVNDHLIHLEVNVRQGIAIHSMLPAVCM